MYGIDGIASMMTTPMKMGQRGLAKMSSWDSQLSQQQQRKLSASEEGDEPEDPTEAVDLGRSRKGNELRKVGKTPSWDNEVTRAARAGVDAGLSATSQALQVTQQVTDGAADTARLTVQGVSSAMATTVAAPRAVGGGVARTSRRVVRTPSLDNELARKIGSAGHSLSHRLHIFVENMRETLRLLPCKWQVVWVGGMLTIVVLGFTVLVVIPFAFTLLLMAWTALVLRLATLEDPSETYAAILATGEMSDLVNLLSELTAAEARIQRQLNMAEQRKGGSDLAKLKDDLVTVEAARDAAVVKLRRKAAEVPAEPRDAKSFTNPLDQLRDSLEVK